MKTVVALLFAIATLTATLSAQPTGYVEAQTTHADGDVGTMVNVWAQGPLVSNFGWFGWGSTSQTWGQTYAGLSFAPIPWAQVGFGAGLESDDHTRFGSFIYLGIAKGYAQLYYEDGSAPWHRATGVYYAYSAPSSGMVLGRIGLGAMNERGLGTGPHVELLAFDRVIVWGAPLFKEDVITGLIGGKLTF